MGYRSGLLWQLPLHYCIYYWCVLFRPINLLSFLFFFFEIFLYIFILFLFFLFFLLLFCLFLFCFVLLLLLLPLRVTSPFRRVSVCVQWQSGGDKEGVFKNRNGYAAETSLGMPQAGLQRSITSGRPLVHTANDPPFEQTRWLLPEERKHKTARIWPKILWLDVCIILIWSFMFLVIT